METIIKYEVPCMVCIKVANLRKKYDKEIDLKKWMKDEKNLYVGRHGRIFIDGEIFHYNGSKWCNPYKVNKGKNIEKRKYTLDESLKLYREHVMKNLYNDLGELSGKVLGCFCSEKDPCHAKVLIELFKEKSEI